jgi:hypothetical protein
MKLNNNSSVQLFILYMRSQQLQGQLQTTAQCRYTILHNGQTHHKVKDKLQEHIIAEKQINKDDKE